MSFYNLTDEQLAFVLIAKRLEVIAYSLTTKTYISYIGESDNTEYPEHGGFVSRFYYDVYNSNGTTTRMCTNVDTLKGVESYLKLIYLKDVEEYFDNKKALN